MTDSSTTTRVSYTGDGSSTNFTITFPFYLATDILVQLAGATVTSGYSVSGGNGSTGTLVMATPPAVGVNVQAILNPPLTQSVNLVDGTAFPSSTLNQVNDRAVQIGLRLQDQINRTLRAPDGDPAPQMLLPTAANRASKALMLDSNGNITLGVPNTQVITTDLLAPFLNLSRTSAEIAAGVTPTNYGYDPAGSNMLRRYGAKVDGSTDDTAAWLSAIAAASAVGGTGYVFVPYGTSLFSSQLVIPNCVTLRGFNREGCVMKFTGSPSGSPASTRTALRYNSGLVNSSGYSGVFFEDFTIWYQNTVNFAAAIEVNAGGWSYFAISNVHVKGNCSYGIILDGAEIATVERCLIENLNPTSNYNIWITNGPDRSAGQTTGFTNIITIRENQISGGAGSFGVVDDGGNGHTICSNNFNQHRIPMLAAGVTGFKTHGNSYETTLQTGSANVLFTSVTAAGTPVGPCSGIAMEADGFFGNLSSGSLLSFQGSLYTITSITKAANAVITVNAGGSVNPFVVGAPIFITGVSGMTQISGQVAYVTTLGGSTGFWTATTNINSSGYSAYVSGGQGQMMHFGAFIRACNFGAQLGRGAAIDVTFLGNSVCEANNDLAGGSPGGASMFHYTGVHNDQCGNRLMPPNNGFPGGINLTGPTFGDTRFAMQFEQAGTFFGQLGLSGAAPPSQVTGWGSPTGAGVVASFPGATATLAQCSQAIAQIIADLKAMGRYGA